MNIACSEGFSPHPQRTTEVAITNKDVRSEGFSPHHQQATTEVVTTNVEIGGLCDV